MSAGRPRVAVCGLGLMGAAIARRLAAADVDLVVWNRSPGPAAALAEAGAAVATSAADAARRADVLITTLADADAVEAVVGGPDGVLAGAADREGAPLLLVEMSTIDAGASARVAEAAGRAGVACLRAPVSGNPAVVAAGNLAILASGPSEAYAAAGPVLDLVGARRWHVGEEEQARVLKLALNAMLAGTAQLLAEALVLAEGHGIGREQALEVIGGSAVGSPFVGYKSAAIVAGDLTTTFSVALMRKDLRLALAGAAEVGAPLPVVELVAGELDRVIAAGAGDRDVMALLPHLEGRVSPTG